MAESNYIFGQVIAKGGMAEVCRGLYIGQDGFKRLVAIKRVLSHYADNAEFAEMFRDEAHIGQRLQHANVVKVECYDLLGGCPAIVMEFVDGSDLRSILAEVERSKEVRRIPVAMALYIIAEAARGLHYAHTRRDDITGRPLEIVHRDISPQNILISYNGEVKVTDFGIASADRDFKNTETKAGIVKGKYSYMSPEQISAKKVDARTDIFALSIVLWEMLGMRRLFTAESEVEVIEMVKNCRIQYKLSELNSDVSKDLEEIVMKGLARDASRRFTSMDELERAVRSLLSKEYPNFTVGDLGNLMKKVLANKHEASQQEIKKLLSDTNLRAAPKTGTPFEIELKGGDAGKSNLTVSRLPSSVVPPHQNMLATPVKASPRAAASNLSRSHGSGRSSRSSNQATAQKRHTILAIALVLTILGAGVFKYQANTAKDTIATTLRSNPSVVRIKVNGQTINGGRYVRTPTRLKLEPGANIIELSRPGYKPDTVSVDTRRNEHKSLPPALLEPSAAHVPVRFVLIGTEPAQVVVNDGFATANLSPTQPAFEVRDVIEGSIADVLVTDKEKESFRCRFSASRGQENRGTVVGIDLGNNRCDVQSGKDRGEP